MITTVQHRPRKIWISDHAVWFNHDVVDNIAKIKGREQQEKTDIPN